MRTGELFAIKYQDVHVDPRTGQGVIVLPHSKSSERTGVRESVVLSDAWLGRLLYLYSRNKPPGELLTPESPHIQRERLTQALFALSLSPTLKWYSLRRGGATFFYQQGMDVARIAVLGRWANTRTARIYINDGLAPLHALLPSTVLKRRLRQRALALCPLFEEGESGI